MKQKRKDFLVSAGAGLAVLASGVKASSAVVPVSIEPKVTGIKFYDPLDYIKQTQAYRSLPFDDSNTDFAPTQNPPLKRTSLISRDVPLPQSSLALALEQPGWVKPTLVPISSYTFHGLFHVTQVPLIPLADIKDIDSAFYRMLYAAQCAIVPLRDSEPYAPQNEVLYYEPSWQALNNVFLRVYNYKYQSFTLHAGADWMKWLNEDSSRKDHLKRNSWNYNDASKYLAPGDAFIQSNDFRIYHAGTLYFQPSTGKVGMGITFMRGMYHLVKVHRRVLTFGHAGLPT